jgi:glycosidase
MGIKVIQDEVCNHTGPYHPWVEDSPTRAWYHGTAANHPANPFQPWMVQDPNAQYEDKRATLDGWFLDILPDMNQSDDEVARYEIQNSLWWVGMTGVDAIRQDTWPYVPRSFWRDWMAALKREYPTLNVVGEMLDGDPALVSFFQGGRKQWDGIDDRVDSMFDFPLMYPIRRAFAEGKPIKEIAQMLARDHLYSNPGMLMTLIGNHDVPRFLNEPNADTSGLKLAQTFLLTTRGIPQLYYGDEIASRGAGDPTNRKDFPGGFPGDQRNAFEKKGRNPEEADVFEHLHQVLRIRSEVEALRRGGLINLYVKDQQYAFARRSERGAALVVFNNDAKPASFEFDVTQAGFGNGTILTDRLDTVRQIRVSAGKVKLNLPARTASILVRR